jgi:hypothetical protein
MTGIGAVALFKVIDRSTPKQNATVDACRSMLGNQSDPHYPSFNAYTKAPEDINLSYSLPIRFGALAHRCAIPSQGKFKRRIFIGPKVNMPIYLAECFLRQSHRATTDHASSQADNAFAIDPFFQFRGACARSTW